MNPLKKLQLFRIKTAKNFQRVQRTFLGKLAKRWVLNDQNLIQAMQQSHYALSYQKQERINRIKPDQKVLFFVFRDIHFLDWFFPIHRALEKSYPNQFVVFYINFGSTLKRVGKDFGYLPYLKGVEERFIQNDRFPDYHFSDQEVKLYQNFPKPDMILTSEAIRKERFETRERVYLPHYTVPKAKDILPENIRYNHVFLPTKPPFSYDEITANLNSSKATLHPVGYPKMSGTKTKELTLFDSDKPVIIYAPSLETEVILDALERGILDTFRKMKQLNFIIKLHPTLASKMQDMMNYITNRVTGASNIIIDSTTSIQDLGKRSAMMIADFGSVGAEYRLSFGKRIIYLEVPEQFRGGADLNFRDHYADGVTTPEKLEETVTTLLEKGDLSPEEMKEMGEGVLYSWQQGDVTAADTIHKILTD